MKKLFGLIAFIGMLVFVNNQVFAQDAAKSDTAGAAQTTAVDSSQTAAADTALVADEKPLHQVFKQKFIEGGVPWMTPILIILIVGLAIIIERILYLNMSTTNTKKLLVKVEEALNEGGIESAKEVCRNTRGPIASIFFQGLDRFSEGLDIVEKSIVSYGGVMMGRLENKLSWITLGIALAPMLGFLGTVVGMVQAFDAIEIAGDISPSLVAGGIKVALLTTIFGLIVAMILQVFYNYLIAKIDGIVADMEDSSITIMDILVKYQHNEKK
jgi:biopolymer transport protein ExbB